MKLAAFAFAAATAMFSAKADIQVGIEVECQGLDYHAMSPKALAYSAEALESSYNAVYKKVDGSVLSHVFTTGPLLSLKKGLRGDGKCRFCGDDTIFGVALSYVSKASDLETLRGDGKCRFCGDDEILSKLDTLSLTYVGTGSASELVGGDGKCRFCGDDEFVAESENAAWESMFSAMLSKNAEFGNVKCGIKANTMNNNFASLGGDGKCRFCGDDSLSAEPMTVDVVCENIDFGDLSVRTLSKSADVLVSTYNAIHQAVDGSSMEDASLIGPRFQVGAGALHGDGKCRFCGDDALVGAEALRGDGKCRFCGDDAFAFGLSFKAQHYGGLRGDGKCRFCGDDAFESATLQAWEDLFRARMIKESEGDFKAAGKCSIIVDADQAAMLK